MSDNRTAESALVVIVPEAEPLAGPFRERYDHSCAAGVPAHVTLLYPFRAPGVIGAGELEDLRACFGRHAPFDFTLAATGRFPGVLYLAPDPAEPFRRLTTAIAGLFPDTPPYRGRHPDVVPHLTLAQVADEGHLDAIAEDFARAASRHLPVRARANEVALMDNASGHWRVRIALPLGSA